MFGFFKKRREANARTAAFRGVMNAIEAGDRNAIEGMIVLNRLQPGNENVAKLIVCFGGSPVFTLNTGDDRIRDILTTQGSDGATYVSVFSSAARAHKVATANGQALRVAEVSPLEIVYSLSGTAGIAINPDDPHINWAFAAAAVPELQRMYEDCYGFGPGSICTVWAKGAYRAAKILATEEGGFHVRLYANKWAERPASVEPGELTFSGESGNEPASYGHLPLRQRAFLAWGPKQVANAPVLDGELDGYRLWQEAKGGYFGA